MPAAAAPRDSPPVPEGESSSTWFTEVAPPRLARRAGTSPVEVTNFHCGALEHVEQQSLGVTYWFEARPAGEPYPMTVHFKGTLVGEAQPETEGGRTSFEVTSTIDAVLPGSGRVAMTTRVVDLAPGTWEVTATPVQPAPEGSGARWREVRAPGLVRGTASGRTAFTPFVRNLAPGVHLGVWPAAVGTGFLVALALQSVLARQLDLPAMRLLLLTLLASSLGLAAAKGYYVLTHLREARGSLTTGMSVQGFVIVTVGTLVTGSFLLDLPIGAVLDVTAPGLLLAMAVGRLGCLFAGCCVGRPTSSRWGVWSSDRRLGVRRIPVQLLESSMAAVVGALALLAVLGLGLGGDGLVLAAALACYVLGRQVLFPLRSIPRATSHGRSLTLVGSTVVLAASIGGIVLG